MQEQPEAGHLSFRMVLYVLTGSMGMCPHPFVSQESLIRQIVCYSSRAKSRTGTASQCPVPKRNGPDFTTWPIQKCQSPEHIEIPFWSDKLILKQLRNFIENTEQRSMKVKSDPAGICCSIRTQKLCASAPHVLPSCCGPWNSPSYYFAFWGIAIIGFLCTRCLLLMFVPCWLTWQHPFMHKPAAPALGLQHFQCGLDWSCSVSLPKVK